MDETMRYTAALRGEDPHGDMEELRRKIDTIVYILEERRESDQEIYRHNHNRSRGNDAPL
jgi:hypothetical protein